MADDIKSEALRLADALTEEHPFPRDIRLAADELRRLVAENAELREANEAFGKRQEWWSDRMFALEQQRDALLEALHHTAEIAHNGGLRSMTEWQSLVLIRKLTLPFFRRSGSIVETHDRVRAAIKAVEEGK